MKSAYERAMERLEAASGPSKQLNDEQRERIGEIDKVFDAKIAQVRMESEEKQMKATTAQEFDAARHELAAELQRLEENREQEKNAVWNE
jgi:hypothetical protein